MRQGDGEACIAQALEYSTGLIVVYFDPTSTVVFQGSLRLVPEGSRIENRTNDWDDEDTQPMTGSEITTPGLPHNVVRPARGAPEE